MNLELQASLLRDAMSSATMLAKKNANTPALQSVRLVTNGKGVYVQATDCEASVNLHVPCDINEPGMVMFPAHRLAAICQSCDADDTIRIDDAVVTVGTSEFTLASGDPEEFPDVPNGDSPADFSMPGNVFRQLLDRTGFATDPDSTRFSLGAILLERSTSGLTAVATDGRRLAMMPADAGMAGETSEVLLPGSIAALVAKTFRGDDPIQLSLEDRVFIQQNGSTLCTRTVEGKFPKWRDVIAPKGSYHSVEFSVEPIAKAVQQAGIVMDDECRGIDFIFANCSVTLKAENQAVGQALITLPAPALDVTVTLDHRFVRDFLTVVDGTFTLKVADAESAVFFEHGRYKYICMPRK